MANCCTFRASDSRTVGALIIRTGFWAPLSCNNNTTNDNEVSQAYPGLVQALEKRLDVDTARKGAGLRVTLSMMQLWEVSVFMDGQGVLA